jgi:hypothetical protein
LMRSLHTTTQQRRTVDWMGDVLGALKGLTAAMTVAAFPPPERFRELVEQVVREKEGGHG